jgi:predicted small lipoprotein YifL
MRSRQAQALLSVAVVALAATGCGVKGPLTLPEKTGDVVIRAPGSEAPATVQPTQKPATPQPDRMPPPPLPSSNPGTGQGG